MIDLNEFRLISSQSGIGTMKLVNSTIVFSKTIVHKLKHPDYIQILANSERRLIVIRACTAENDEAIPFVRKKQEGQVIIRKRGIFREVSKLIIGYDPALYDSIIMDGEYNDEQQIYIFNAREFYSDKPQVYMPGMDRALQNVEPGNI